MCGIFGVIAVAPGGPITETSRPLVERLLKLSESRGKDASGLAVVRDDGITVLKQPFSASRLIRSAEFSALFDATVAGGESPIRAVMGHARMETNGSFAKSVNNQPVVKDGCVTIHNGIIVNDRALWERFPELKREFDVDTEVVNALFRKYLREGCTLDDGVLRSLSALEGAYSIATIFEDLHQVVLATNTGSLYSLSVDGFFIFASEEAFLREIAPFVGLTYAEAPVTHIKPQTMLFWDLAKGVCSSRSFVRNGHPAIPSTSDARRTVRVLPSAPHAASGAPIVCSPTFWSEIERAFEVNRAVIDSLRRCTKCILPETMPFITFDAAGECNYCRDYQPVKLKGREALEDVLKRFRHPSGGADCIVPFSGGRDSSYGVYLIREKLGMNPITYTYDWGMVTDLARRNIARVCGKLGIEHILISADIQAKRANIKRNVEAWMRRPELGTIPLFMAGDKHFLYFVNKVKRATGVKLDIWLPNFLERTHFKVGFCGIPPGKEERVDSLSPWAKLRLLAYYGMSVLKNPAFLNRSIWDSLFAYYSYYFEPRPNYHVLYEYLPWEEKEVEQTLFREFDWEVAPDTKSTWRIGDGTAPFYNYIYYTIAGFSEIDTFRSNQIREGMLSREEALALARRDNVPRREGLEWYFNAIRVDIEQCLRIVNAMPKRYAS